MIPAAAILVLEEDDRPVHIHAAGLSRLEEYADTALAAAAGPVFFERFIKKALFGRDPDEGIAAKALSEAVPPALAYLETRAPSRPRPLLGEFSIADAATGGQLGSLRLAGVSIDRGSYPKLAAYGDAPLERPSFAKALASSPKRGSRGGQVDEALASAASSARALSSASAHSAAGSLSATMPPPV
jgi:glutathione S-transferase